MPAIAGNDDYLNLGPFKLRRDGWVRIGLFLAGRFSVSALVNFDSTTKATKCYGLRRQRS
jgi:hypothetical protein